MADQQHPEGLPTLPELADRVYRNREILALMKAYAREALRAQAAGVVTDDGLISKDRVYVDDHVQDIAHALAQECEAAELDPNDLVTINREKLVAIARRVLHKAHELLNASAPPAHVPADVEARLLSFLACEIECGIYEQTVVPAVRNFFNAQHPTPEPAQAVDARQQIEAIARAHGTGGWQTLDDMVRFGLAVSAALAARQPQATDCLDGVNIQNLTDALSWLGYATDTHECMAVRLSDYVNRITSAVLQHKDLWRQPQAQQGGGEVDLMASAMRMASAELGRSVIVAHVNPSIPVRDHDYCAYYDDAHPDGPQGWGKSPMSAVAELKEKSE